MGFGDLHVCGEEGGYVPLLGVRFGVCHGVWEESGRAFCWFRADHCFVCVSLQELLPEEILWAVLAAGERERRRAGRWGKCWARRVPAA